MYRNKVKEDCVASIIITCLPWKLGCGILVFTGNEISSSGTDGVYETISAFVTCQDYDQMWSRVSARDSNWTDASTCLSCAPMSKSPWRMFHSSLWYSQPLSGHLQPVLKYQGLSTGRLIATEKINVAHRLDVWLDTQYKTEMESAYGFQIPASSDAFIFTLMLLNVYGSISCPPHNRHRLNSIVDSSLRHRLAASQGIG